MSRWIPAVLGLLMLSCGSPSYPVTETSRQLASSPYSVAWHLVTTLSHDGSSYTEGLVFDGDRLYESVGLAGASRLLELAPDTGITLRTVHWPKHLEGNTETPFAEGLAIANGRLVQLSWKNHRAVTWDVTTFARGADLRYEGEGWGLCFDGSSFWRSDGTTKLYRHDPTTFAPVGTPLTVRVGDADVQSLNELECVSGVIYANVWQKPFVVRIDPATGGVTGVLDLRPLVDDARAAGSESVLNGLAFRSSTRRMYVTGKRWKKMYVIELDE